MYLNDLVLENGLEYVREHGNYAVLCSEAPEFESELFETSDRENPMKEDPYPQIIRASLAYYRPEYEGPVEMDKDTCFTGMKLIVLPRDGVLCHSSGHVKKVAIVDSKNYDLLTLTNGDGRMVHLGKRCRADRIYLGLGRIFFHA